ncbi:MULTISPECIES: HGxxPAAW family protein [unclassified Streptomyces]|jgi:ABC-type iron transport system FetAB permease component|uniref:HGxxPAAW family protein n=1 Tax=unclassified Streptomyces TaxID=2593676 RepID=UPI00332F04E4
MAGSSHGHGHTPAAWTGVIISFIGFCVAGAFMVMAQPVGFWAGMVLILGGAVVGGIMRAMGLGAKQAPLKMSGAPLTTREPAGVES